MIIMSIIGLYFTYLNIEVEELINKNTKLEYKIKQLEYYIKELKELKSK